MLGIAGWVRNNHDGSVEVLAMGTRDQLLGLRIAPAAKARVPHASMMCRGIEAEAGRRPHTFRIEGAW